MSSRAAAEERESEGKEVGKAKLTLSSGAKGRETTKNVTD